MDPDRAFELRLALAPGDAARVLEHPAIRDAMEAPAEVRHFHTVYFDTRDLKLVRAGMTLRLRRSGGKQIQTVTIRDASSTGLVSRRSVALELAGDRPDCEAIPDEAIRARLLDALAGQPLEPIFETQVKRTHLRLCIHTIEWSVDLEEGDLRAGFAHEWISELKLELYSGPTSHLYDFALELSEVVPLWPATRSTVARGQALRRGAGRQRPERAKAPDFRRSATLKQAIAPIGLSCLEQICVNAAPAWDGIDPEGVHQMRVGVRRTRSFLALIQAALPSARLSRLRTELRWLAGLLGDVRDFDILIEARIRPQVAEHEGDSALRLLLGEAIAVREERRQMLRHALRSRRYSQLVLGLGHWIACSAEEDPIDADTAARLDQPASRFAEEVVARSFERAARLARRSHAGSPAAYHRLRIAVKKLRYAGQFFHRAYESKKARRHLRRLSRLQDLLGALNDLETARLLLRLLIDRGGPEHALELSRAAGFVEGCTASEDQRVLRKIALRLQRFEEARAFWVRTQSTR